MGGDARYDAYLAAHGFNRDEYREIVTSQLHGELLRSELNKSISVTEEEMRRYYEEHRRDPAFQKPELVAASHILVAARTNMISQKLESQKNLTGDNPTATVRREMDRLRKRAEGLRRQALSGADFGRLAREYSDDPGTRDRGGDLGTFPRATHARTFDDAAFALTPGQISNVVQTDFGFHVIKVAKHEPARDQTFEEASPEIRRRLLAQLEAQRLTDWIKDARSRTTIRINEPFWIGALQIEFPRS